MRGVWNFWFGIFAHMVLTAMPQVQCPFDCNFYLQEVRRHIWNELGVDHCSVLLLTSTAHWVTHQSRGKNERKNILKIHLSQKFGKAYLQFQF